MESAICENLQTHLEMELPIAEVRRSSADRLKGSLHPLKKCMLDSKF
jgi:hypothetical protein